MIKFIADYTIEGVESSTVSELVEWISKRKYIVLDTETASKNKQLKDFLIHNQQVTMLQIGDKNNQWAIDVRSVDIEPLREWLETTKILKVIHNAKFDYQVISLMGFNLENVFDTMLVEYIRYTGLTQKKGFYTLEESLARYTGRRPYGNQLDFFKP